MPRKNRTIRLYKEQQGICWICSLPMFPPRKNPKTRNIHPFEATLDHLVPKHADGLKNTARPAKAAHAKCNSSRHHYPTTHPEVERHIQNMQNKFKNSNLISEINKARSKFLGMAPATETTLAPPPSPC
jgi:hypothetical protein